MLTPREPLAAVAAHSRPDRSLKLCAGASVCLVLTEPHPSRRRRWRLLRMRRQLMVRRPQTVSNRTGSAIATAHYLAAATNSISTCAPPGSAATATVVRAGRGASKNVS